MIKSTDLNQTQLDALIVQSQRPASFVAISTAHLKALLLEVVRRRLADDAEPLAAVNPDGCPVPAMP